MKNLKKFLALALAATMVVGNGTVAWAADEGTDTGTGELEGTVSTDVWQVVVPTDAGTAFDFTLDPEGLIAKTNEERYGGGDKYQDDATVFFANTAEDASVTYSDTSDVITIVNKGTQLAKITLEAEMSALDVGGNQSDDITMATSSTFADTTVSLYLAFVDADGSETAITGDNTSPTEKTAVIGAAPEGAYEYKYDSQNTKYAYDLVDDLTGIEFEEYSFRLTGACNSAADWSALSAAAPVVTVTWNVAAYTPTGTAATFTAGSNVGEITYTDGTTDYAIDEIISVEMVNAGGSYDGYVAYEGAWAAAEDDGSKIVLSSDFIKFFDEAGTGKCDATVTYKTTLGQIVTVEVKDVLVAAP